jgi:hypothetical protein
MKFIWHGNNVKSTAILWLCGSVRCVTGVASGTAVNDQLPAAMSKATALAQKRNAKTMEDLAMRFEKMAVLGPPSGDSDSSQMSPTEEGGDMIMRDGKYGRQTDRQT